MCLSASTRLLLLSVLMLFFGCSQWNTSSSEGLPQLPLAKLSSDGIGIEIATVTVLPEQRELLPKVLAELDEQVLDTEIRRLLALNGVRVGVFGSQLPESIHLLLMEASDRTIHPTGETQWISDEQRYVQCQPGKTFEIPIWKAARNIELQFDNGHFLIPESLDVAIPTLQFAGQAKGEAAQLRLWPLVHFGPLRQKYVVADNTFHFEAKQEQREYDQLEIEIPLQAGEVLLITCDEKQTHADANPQPLGDSFFLDEHRGAQKLVLLRLAQTPIQDTFAETSLLAE